MEDETNRRSSRSAMNEEQLARFSARLRHLQRQRSLSIRQIAKQAHLSPGSVQRLFSGDQEPRLGTLFALMSAFDFDSIELLLGDSTSNRFLGRSH